MHSTTVFLVAAMAVFHAASANPFTALFGAIDNEVAPYGNVIKYSKFETRRYLPQLWAQVDYAVNSTEDFSEKSSAGFMPLFQYISGKNEKQQKIPMTAPVYMQRIANPPGQFRMAFVMPSSLFTKLEQMPKPTDSTVKIVAVTEPLTFSCITFNMGLNGKRAAEKEAELREAAAAAGTTLATGVDSVRIAGYNPPWTLPWFRTNEVCIPLAKQ